MNLVDLARLERASQAAKSSPRLRSNDNLHRMEDPIHRLLNATEPGTYVQPHRHRDKDETLSVVRGRGAILLFDDRGAISECAVLSPQGPVFVAEIPKGAWHTLVALEPATVWFEVKPGPYAAPPPADVAGFAPAPGSHEAPAHLARWVAHAKR